MVTGVTRDRLRTWKRRFGWPRPERRQGGPRRYRTDDVPRVVAVRRLQESGTPLDQAIGSRSDPPTGSIGASTWKNVVEELPFPFVLLSGPAQLIIEYANVTVRDRPDGPRVGDNLEDVAPWFGEQQAGQLRELFAADARVARVAHPDWTSGLARPTRSLAIRVRQTAHSRPLVALVGLDDSDDRQSRAERARLRHERARIRDDGDQQRAWATAAREVAVVTHSPGMRAVRAGLLALSRRLELSDVGIYVVDDDTPQLITSLRGRFARVSESALLEAVQFGEVRRTVWLAPGAASRIGAPVNHGLLMAGAPARENRHCVLALPSRDAPDTAPGANDLLESCAHHFGRTIP